MAQLNPKEMQQALALPFAPEDLEWRLQNTIEEKMRGLAVPYVTNRAIQNRLDEVCGPENWYNDFKPWHMAYSDIMDYLHGQKLRAVLEDDPEYFYEGRFVVNVWKSEKDWSRITIDYDVGPYKWSVLSSTDDWLWDPFNFQNGVIRPAVFKDIAVTTEVRAVKLAALLFGRAPVCPVFRVSSSDKRGVHIRFINPTLGLDETKLLPDGVIQFPEFVFFGDLGATLELWCDTGTGSVSVDFRQGRL